MPARERLLCVSVHDVGWHRIDLVRALLASIHEVGNIPLTLLVVPNYHEHGGIGIAPFEQFLAQRLALGDELALHGLTHQDPIERHGVIEHLRRDWYTRGEAEFSRLDRHQATARLRVGLDWFARRGWPVHGFVAPAWMLSAAAFDTLRSEPAIRYTETWRQVMRLDHVGATIHRHRAPAIVYSSADDWRKRASRTVTTTFACMLRAAPLVRLALHPADVTDAPTRRHWQRLLACLAAERRVMTMREFIELRTGADPHRVTE